VGREGREKREERALLLLARELSFDPFLTLCTFFCFCFCFRWIGLDIGKSLQTLKPLNSSLDDDPTFQGNRRVVSLDS